MKKRLRKKKHYGEFTEWGRQLVIMRNRKDRFDEFLDAFIEEAIAQSLRLAKILILEILYVFLWLIPPRRDRQP